MEIKGTKTTIKHEDKQYTLHQEAIGWTPNGFKRVEIRDAAGHVWIRRERSMSDVLTDNYKNTWIPVKS